MSLVELNNFFMNYPYQTKNTSDGSHNICGISNLLQGDFLSYINGPVFKELFMVSSLETSLENILKIQVEESLSKSEHKTLKQYELLCLGISSLQMFVQINWTGPTSSYKSDPPLQFLRNLFTITKDLSESQWNERLFSELLLDGEAISSNICCLELLLVARAVLLANIFEDVVSAEWWRLRCLFVHQQVLEERSPILYEQLGRLITQLSECESVQASSALNAQLHLEAVSIWLYYGHVGKADKAVKAACKLLGLDINLVGALGKRTKFQEKEIAQLTLGITVDREDGAGNFLDTSSVIDYASCPKDVRLEDEVRLNQIEFSDSSVSQLPELTPMEQAAVLATCMHRQKSQPKDKLQPEEIFPYISCLTAQPRVWALQMSALLHRSKLDSEDKRTVERSLMQFQSLLDSVVAEEPSSVCRLAWVYCSYLPPVWKIESLLANTYISLGMVQTALDVFLKLQLWEEVIACYNYLKLRHKAAEVIQQELEKKRTVKLLCLLGDATDNVDCYRQAWELSEQRSARSQRHWAMYYFSRKQYGESIPHLEKSLDINSLQETLWFRLGFAALVQENWDLSAKAYRRYCSLEPESFEAWNNLAKAYVKTGQKAKAFRALQEAVKCNYENWRVWDNLMAVSTDCGQFDEVIRCYHRILDLKEKHVDEEVLKLLTDVVVKELINTTECPIAKLRKQSLTLFGRLTSQVMSNSTLWQLYAQLASTEEPTAETRAKVAQCLQKAYRAATQGCWERDLTSCQQVIDLSTDLAKAYKQCSQQYSSSNEAFQMLYSAKLPLKSVLSKVEKEQTDLITGKLPESIARKHKELLKHYEEIVDELERLKPS